MTNKCFSTETISEFISWYSSNAKYYNFTVNPIIVSDKILLDDTWVIYDEDSHVSLKMNLSDRYFKDRKWNYELKIVDNHFEVIEISTFNNYRVGYKRTTDSYTTLDRVNDTRLYDAVKALMRHCICEQEELVYV